MLIEKKNVNDDLKKKFENKQAHKFANIYMFSTHFLQHVPNDSGFLQTSVSKERF